MTQDPTSTGLSIWQKKFPEGNVPKDLPFFIARTQDSVLIPNRHSRKDCLGRSLIRVPRLKLVLVQRSLIRPTILRDTSEQAVNKAALVSSIKSSISYYYHLCSLIFGSSRLFYGQTALPPHRNIPLTYFKPVRSHSSVIIVSSWLLRCSARPSLSST